MFPRSKTTVKALVEPLLQQGLSKPEIAQRTGLRLQSVHIAVYQIQHPSRLAAARQKYIKTLREETRP
jgi:hypothetical protein